MPRTEDTAGESGSTCHPVRQLWQGAAETARVEARGTLCGSCGKALQAACLRSMQGCHLFQGLSGVPPTRAHICTIHIHANASLALPRNLQP